MQSIVLTPTDSRLSDLQRDFASLGCELVDIQSTYHSLRKEHGRQCSEALTEALSSLLRVVKYVNKTDKALIYWLQKGDTLKLALRCVGIDKRTDAIVERKTEAIKGQVAQAETKFNQSGEVVMDGLKAVQNLNTRVTRYSLSSVGNAEEQAQDLCQEFASNVNSVELSLEQSKTECITIQGEIDDIPSQIDGVQSQRQAAQGASDSSATVECSQFTVYTRNRAKLLTRLPLMNRLPLQVSLLPVSQASPRCFSLRLAWLCCQQRHAVWGVQ